ncbi:hypothetical protein NEOLI_001876 [Neolecta irregularis DAH-3]|uniref:WW domain-containing protein n=1 Tax=Neolecta irregularis (strain DAH-3) TaxID=1198029 RepID=A0A1U7LPD3_NEOID|nr:hypothetical protein NEOLI_001876 [Neolecta irregularis DAH-3]|eukprot:OLL24526.1 hypothetical protein NEOLI_001876 [Neolecta irregularis DAH-3]
MALQLPLGWIEQFDNHRQIPFYVNTATGKSQWDPPSGSFPSSQSPPAYFSQNDAPPFCTKPPHANPTSYHPGSSHEQARDTKHTGKSAATSYGAYVAENQQKSSLPYSGHSESSSYYSQAAPSGSSSGHPAPPNALHSGSDGYSSGYPASSNSYTATPPAGHSSGYSASLGLDPSNPYPQDGYSPPPNSYSQAERGNHYPVTSIPPQQSSGAVGGIIGQLAQAAISQFGGNKLHKVDTRPPNDNKHSNEMDKYSEQKYHGEEYKHEQHNHSGEKHSHQDEKHKSDKHKHYEEKKHKKDKHEDSCSDQDCEERKERKHKEKKERKERKKHKRRGSGGSCSSSSS